jgi:hypothetical protein
MLRQNHGKSLHIKFHLKSGMGIAFLKILSKFPITREKMNLVTNHISWRWLWWNPKDASWAMVGL